MDELTTHRDADDGDVDHWMVAGDAGGDIGSALTVIIIKELKEGQTTILPDTLRTAPGDPNPQTRFRSDLSPQVNDINFH